MLEEGEEPDECDRGVAESPGAAINEHREEGEGKSEGEEFGETRGEVKVPRGDLGVELVAGTTGESEGEGTTHAPFGRVALDNVVKGAEAFGPYPGLPKV